MKNIIKDAFILFAITAVAGILLALVNEVTKKPIEDGKRAAVEEACREVFPEASSFESRALPEGDAAYEEFKRRYPKDVIDGIYDAKDTEGMLLGTVLNITNKEGYGGNLSFSMGIALDGTIKGTAILETSETPGLGLNAADVLLPQFKDRKAESFVYVKGGGATGENEVDAISSATITTRAFTNGINAGLDFFRSIYLK